MTQPALDLARFNAMSADAAEAVLRTCCDSPDFARAVAAARPFADLPAVLHAAANALALLSEDELDRAVAAHPRIGGPTTSASSAREQAGVDPDDRDALAAGNTAYELRFGHRYLVHAAGRGGAELLDLLTTRLGNDPATERRIMRVELGRINRTRLLRLFGAEA
ncbi:2-oxo-4-hydroxy-4-carboxy-5-ureidoimidazoline decarboxylase [Nocardia takedensis]|uniref:2-oxo-4-hydroxy-4-carboxy-5-ureidoimidazoline decarboxylase n=1 Tax=Nocardia takedensis TaxID=259390 RepID=UPI0002EFCC3A|nr:2-oxo-4-hydroxy-4-carboxy-5-ureidoimidazoline decarboxylase [Nocardia takedensis]